MLNFNQSQLNLNIGGNSAPTVGACVCISVQGRRGGVAWLFFRAISARWAAGRPFLASAPPCMKRGAASKGAEGAIRHRLMIEVNMKAYTKAFYVAATL